MKVIGRLRKPDGSVVKVAALAPAETGWPGAERGAEPAPPAARRPVPSSGLQELLGYFRALAAPEGYERLF